MLKNINWRINFTGSIKAWLNFLYCLPAVFLDFWTKWNKIAVSEHLSLIQNAGRVKGKLSQSVSRKQIGNINNEVQTRLGAQVATGCSCMPDLSETDILNLGLTTSSSLQRLVCRFFKKTCVNCGKQRKNTSPNFASNIKQIQAN